MKLGTFKHIDTGLHQRFYYEHKLHGYLISLLPRRDSAVFVSKYKWELVE